MTVSRLDVKIGDTSFVAEGSEAWVSQQFEIFTRRLDRVAAVPTKGSAKAKSDEATSEANGSVSSNLPKHLQDK